jgi:DNA-directed RNA polymerase II subunit RPB2
MESPPVQVFREGEGEQEIAQEQNTELQNQGNENVEFVENQIQTQEPRFQEITPQENEIQVNSNGIQESTPPSIPIPEGPSSVVLPPLIEKNPQPMDATIARQLAMNLIHTYFTSQTNPLTNHHIESFDQFLQVDLLNIIKSHNPLTILKQHKKAREEGSKLYDYKAEIFIGNESGTELFIGTPTIVLEQGRDVRLLFPNEARLRNLTYALQIEANVLVRVTMRVPQTDKNPKGEDVHDIPVFKIPLFNMPLMLHSNYCVLHGKSTTLLTQMGECPQDQGGYFIIDGSEKVLITRQEGAFNTLWIQEYPADDDYQFIGQISSLNPVTREVKPCKFFWTREKTRRPGVVEKTESKIGEKEGDKKTTGTIYKQPVLEVQIPYVEKPIPIFVLFRALGVQTDKDIVQTIFPDFENPETKLLADMLIPSINQAAPFLDTFSAIQYIKSQTKGFSIYHVMDILHNHLFPHVHDLPNARIQYLGECIRKMLRVIKGLDSPPSKDDTRNQRLLTSGFLCQMLFKNIYKYYVEIVKRKGVDELFNYKESLYTGLDFLNIFNEQNRRNVFKFGYITDGIMRGFKGKWLTGHNKEESGVLQELSRLSFLDFTSHLRRAVLNFDMSLKLQGPRRLNPSQYGYFCTSETPSGSHIGITKNLSMMTAISTNVNYEGLLHWLYTRGEVLACEHITPELASVMIPVYLNSGILGYTNKPKILARVLRFLKRTGYLPPLSSSGFNIPEKRLFIFTDDGRPLRPLLICHTQGVLPDPRLYNRRTWRDYVVGMYRPETQIGSREFVDPLKHIVSASLNSYIDHFEKDTEYLKKAALIEYVDPYEQNELLLANYPEHITKQTTHMEVHPSTILGLLGNMIPYPNHNQSPRNQLSASQSKQGLSMYATNWTNRFDNTANVLCYGQAPLSRTIYQDYVGNGKMAYGQNIILAMGMYGGYNQEDGIIMNADALARGQFRSINYRSYEAFEENDTIAHTQTRIGNPKEIPGWLNLNPRLDYSKLDETGIVKIGEYVDQYTAIVGRFMKTQKNELKDASVTPQVWTRGRVEKVSVMVNNMGLRLVKVRIVQDRVPELGDKFSNRHGQKGTINVLYRGHDMPRTADGIVPDMIMNPTAIPSRMTIGQILEMMLGNVCAELGMIGNSTAFMNDGSPHPILGSILESLGLNKMCNQVLYNGMTGEQMTADIYMGVVYGMRLKHMTEDKWNARGDGRKEQRTHQPTGGRGNEGGLKIGEMERDAICAHGVTTFIQESFMKRSDGTEFIVCNGCGTIPIYNEQQNFYLCPLCDGPIQYSGDTIHTLNPIPPSIRSAATFSKVEMPYATKLFFQEMETFENLGFRILTTQDTARLKGMDKVDELLKVTEMSSQPLPQLRYTEPEVPLVPENKPAPTANELVEELARTQQEAVQTYQNQQMTPLVTSVQQPPPVLPATQVIPSFVGSTPSVQTNTIELAPGSMEPSFVQRTLPTNEVQGAVIATTDAGQPIINVATDSNAMAESGLVEPKDINRPLPQPQMGQQPRYSNTRSPRRSRSNSPMRQQSSQQQTNYNYNPYQGQEQGQEQEERAPLTPSHPIKVEKLG